MLFFLGFPLAGPNSLFANSACLFSLSLSLLWFLALGVSAAAHLLWWPLLCWPYGNFFLWQRCCIFFFLLLLRMLSALAEPPWCVFSAGLGTPVVFPLGVMWLTALLGFPCWLSFTRGRPYGKRSSSSSRTGGRLRFRGWGGGGLLLPGLRVSGGGSHLLSGPFPAVVCPSISRPGGTGVRSLGL